MSASDYPVSFPFGATDAPYNASHPHRGQDYPCPEGTPLVIVGQTIGLTGSTGMVIGSHLHVQEWLNDVASVRKPEHPFEAGIVIQADSNPDQQWGKHLTIQNADGWNTTYCHLSEVDVTVGQEIKGEDMIQDSDNEYARFEKLGQQVRGRSLTRDEFKAVAVGNTWLHVIETLSDDSEADAHAQALVNATSVADTRLKFENQLWNASGVDVSKVTDEGTATTQAVANIDQKNKMIATYQLAKGNVEATAIGKALIKLFQTFGYKKG